MPLHAFCGFSLGGRRKIGCDFSVSDCTGACCDVGFGYFFVYPDVFKNVAVKRGSRPFLVASEVAIHAIVWQNFSNK